MRSNGSKGFDVHASMLSGALSGVHSEWTPSPLEPLLRITALCRAARPGLPQGQQVDEAAGQASGARAEEARAREIIGDASETALL